MKARTALFTAVAAGLGYLALNRLRTRPLLNLRGKAVLITGGSRGLGLALAREFGSQGCSVVICARTQSQLERARLDLAARGIPVHTFVCDVTDPAQVQAMIADATAQAGPIDILVNNAGIIKVGPVSDMDIHDFEQAMNVMFWGPLHTIMAVLPSMRLRKAGSIVNITSIGGKVSVPHLLPYSCAKFAAVALSEGLRAELAFAGIVVTTIAPGLLRTGSHLNAEFKGDQMKEYAWFAAGAATPIISISAERAARSIVRAVVHGESGRVLSIPADIAARVHGLLPGLTAELMTLANRLLPSPTNNGNGTRKGFQMEQKLNSGLWKLITRSGQNAATSLNETP